MIVQCDNCGCNFKCDPSRYNHSKTHCCSKKCQSEYKKKQNLNCVCDECGKKFHKKPSQLAKNKNNFCSKECKAKWDSAHMTGENNHQFGLKGELNSSFKSNEKISTYGYKLIRVPNHPFVNCDGFVFEHRLVAEQYLLTDKTSVVIDGKKYLSPNYVVHHKDENRLNNSVDNLEIMMLGNHVSMHNKENPHPRDGLGRFI